jgi:type II secretory ATPase GspE/PulE/Tfp pilus assembly ATPase PilB-like protein
MRKDGANGNGGSANARWTIQEMGRQMKAIVSLPLKQQIVSEPVTRMANAILSTAIDKGALDIAVYPTPKGGYVGVRRSRRMEWMMTLPQASAVALVTRYKYMADLNPSRSDVPQVGYIPILHNKRRYTLKVWATPEKDGTESLSIWIMEAD